MSALALLAAASLTAADIRSEMRTVENKLIALGYVKVRGTADELEAPVVIVSIMLPAPSLLSAGLREIAILDHPDSCFELRLQYELSNYLVGAAYGDYSERAAHRIADTFEPWSPNCMNLPTGCTLGAYTHAFAP